ncbi:MAG TPA: hypothetical protein VG269_05540 [Tepidisphaeraceae bacterium]|jgi:hypothetical protein|nr:hypothetical protein [Tepidisphaeraceae bacterium]
MRSLLLVILSCVLLGGGFVVYSWLQPGSPGLMKGNEQPSAVPPKDKGTQTLGTIHHGTGAWYETRDDEGSLKTRFRADEYVPQNNGIVLAKNPEAEFYTGHNQMMRLRGTTGEIVVPDAPDAAKTSGGQPPAAAPNRGRIHDVTIEMFGLGPDSKPDKADETLVADNIQFDNETLLITTESFVDASGKTVPPDQVPVKMRTNPDHKRYDFDGRGLRLRWNDKDGRLEMLEIAHGEQLTVYDTGGFSESFGGAPATRPAAPPAALSGPLPMMLAAADKSAAANALPPPRKPMSRPARAQAAKTRQYSPPVPYRATFYESVVVTQGDEVHVTADRMNIDFLSKQQPAAGPTTGPATAPANNPAARANAPRSAAPAGSQDISPALPTPAAPTGVVDASAVAPSAAPATRPSATQPTTQRSQAPLVVRWTGKLTMFPSEPGQRPKLAPGDAAIELTGSPVVLRRTPAGQQDGNDVLCASLVYHTADGSAMLRGSEAFPEVVLGKLINGKKDPLSTVTTSMLDYVTGKSATLTGRGHATVPADSAAPAKGVMDAKWTRSAKLYFAGRGGPDEMAIEHMDLAGDVDVLHPQMALKSQALSLFFERPPIGPATRPAGPQTGPAGDPGDAVAIDAPATRPSTRPAGGKHGPATELRTVLASDTVHCQLTDSAGKKQTIDCDSLELRTAHADDGKLFARQVDANGAVHAYDGEQDLRAGSIALTLRPAKPAATDGAKGPTTRPADERAAVAKAPERPTTGPATQPADSSLAAGELETMTARENVQVTGKDGAVATGDELIVTTEDGEPHVRLTAAKNARVIDAKKNTVSGPVITAEPRKQLAHVIGTGTMHVLREQEAGKKPEPMDVAWTDRADMDGAANRIDVLGAVQVDMTDSDGALNHATGEHIRIDLKPKPPAATQPATRPAIANHGQAARPAEVQKPGDKPAIAAVPATTRPAAQASTRPAKAGGVADSMQMDLMKDKEVKSVTLDGKATVTSTLSGKDGSILRRFSLQGPTIIYSLFDAAGQPGRTMLVPSAGQMLVQDHRPAPPATKPKPGQPPAEKKPDDGQMDTGHGDTAFQWSKQLLYSELLHNAVMTGDVLIVHQNLEGKEDPVRMNADTVTAWFAPAPQTKPAVAVAPAPAAQPAALQLKKLTAEGHVLVSRGGSQLSASRIDFDPVTHWMAASGSKDRPAVFQDPGTGKTLSGKQLWWNTQTWDVKLKEPAMVNPH